MTLGTPYGGLRIVVSHLLAREEQVGHHIEEIRAHPLAAWILRLFGRSDHVMFVSAGPIVRTIDDQAAIDHERGILYITPAMARNLGWRP